MRSHNEWSRRRPLERADIPFSACTHQQHSQYSTHVWNRSGIPPMSFLIQIFLSPGALIIQRPDVLQLQPHTDERRAAAQSHLSLPAGPPGEAPIPVPEVPPSTPPKTIGQRGMRSPLPRVSCPEPDQPAESHGALRLTWHKESRRDERALPAPGALPALRSGSRRPTAVAHPSAAPRAAPPPLWAAGRAPLSISGGGARPPLASRRQ